MPMWKGLILLGLLLVGCSSDPAVSQATHDRAVAELRAEIHAARDMLKDQTAINTSLTEKNEELDTALAASQKEAASLEKKIDALSQDMSDLKQTLIENKSIREPVNPQKYYAGVLGNPVRVDWYSNSDLAKCPLISEYKAKNKGPTSVEIWFAGREDGTEDSIGEQLDVEVGGVWRHSSGLSSRDEDIEFKRILDNPWNSTDDPFATVLYKGYFPIDEIWSDDYDIHRAYVSLSGYNQWNDNRLETRCDNNGSQDEDYVSAHKDNIVDGSFIVAWYVD